MKTLLQICQQIGNMPNSKFKKNIVSIADIDNKHLGALNRALSVLWNKVNDWDLRHKKITFNTVIGQSAYDMVNGIIKEKGMKISDATAPLSYESDHENLTDQSGTPDSYWIEGDDIVLYPTPNAVKVITVKYRKEYAVITTGLIEQDYFVNITDVLNIPSRIEKYFIDCLGHLSNQMLNGDQTDEEYLEHGDRFNEALIILKNADKGSLDIKTQFIL